VISPDEIKRRKRAGSMARPRRRGAGDREEGQPRRDAGDQEEELPWPKLSNRHRRTLEMIFERPTRGNIRWAAVVGLLAALGARIHHGEGSRRRFLLRDRVAILHEPHPGNEVKKGAVEDIRDFLIGLGLRP
jgi:hypothetical protein